MPEIKVTISGGDGEDAHFYQVRQVNDAIEKLKEDWRE